VSAIKNVLIETVEPQLTIKDTKEKALNVKAMRMLLSIKDVEKEASVVELVEAMKMLLHLLLLLVLLVLLVLLLLLLLLLLHLLLLLLSLTHHSVLMLPTI